jgi:hypothetical protein
MGVLLPRVSLLVERFWRGSISIFSMEASVNGGGGRCDNVLACPLLGEDIFSLQLLRT